MNHSANRKLAVIAAVCTLLASMPLEAAAAQAPVEGSLLDVIEKETDPADASGKEDTDAAADPTEATDETDSTVAAEGTEATEATESTEPTGSETPDASEKAETPAHVTPGTSIVTNDDGTRSVMLTADDTFGGVLRFPAAGHVVVSPDFPIGDLTDDKKADASDASLVLVASTAAGVGSDAREVLLAEDPALGDVENAMLYADVNYDGVIDARDASEILIYSTARGVGEVEPLGTWHLYADENGILQTGFVTDKTTGARYYAEESGRLANGWFSADGKRYYAGADDAILTGQQTIDGKTFLFGEDGALVEASWYTDADGQRFYLDETGAPTKGVAEIDGKTYYFDPETGVMTTGWAHFEDGDRYYDENGVQAAPGWLKTDAGTFYISEDGTRLIRSQVIDGETYYFFADSGRMAVGWVNMAQGQMYFAGTGARVYGLQSIGGRTYLFNDEGICQTGLLDVDGKHYYFDPIERAAVTGWITLEDEKYYGGTDGAFLTGWQTIDGAKYYFYETGIMAKDTVIDNINIDSTGVAVSAMLLTNRERAQAAFAKYGTSVSGIYNYVRATTRYKKIESTRTLAQIESKGWLYFVDYSMTHYYGVCYYLAAKTDFLLREAGYNCRVVHATHGSGDHYWNQVYTNGTWVNYDLTNGLYAYSMSSMISYGSYTILGYVTPTYK